MILNHVVQEPLDHEHPNRHRESMSCGSCFEVVSLKFIPFFQALVIVRSGVRSKQESDPHHSSCWICATSVFPALRQCRAGAAPPTTRPLPPRARTSGGQAMRRSKHLTDCAPLPGLDACRQQLPRCMLMSVILHPCHDMCHLPRVRQPSPQPFTSCSAPAFAFSCPTTWPPVRTAGCRLAWSSTMRGGAADAMHCGWQALVCSRALGPLPYGGHVATRSTRLSQWLMQQRQLRMRWLKGAGRLRQMGGQTMMPAVARRQWLQGAARSATHHLAARQVCRLHLAGSHLDAATLQHAAQPDHAQVERTTGVHHQDLDQMMAAAGAADVVEAAVAAALAKAMARARAAARWSSWQGLCWVYAGERPQRPCPMARPIFFISAGLPPAPHALFYHSCRGTGLASA